MNSFDPVLVFISDLKASCKENGIRLYLPKSKSIKCGSFAVSGYFDDITKVLACAMNREDSVATLIHESCHLDQYIENTELWRKLERSADLDSWLLGKDIENVESTLSFLRQLELDCEKRSVKKYKKYGIKFNKCEYIQKANAYVQLYNFLKYSRKWPKKGKSPYMIKQIWESMPIKFMTNRWYKNISKRHMKLYIQNL